MSSLRDRLFDSIQGSHLIARLETSAAPFLERRSGDVAAAQINGDALKGLARVLASQPMVAGFLSHRPALFERIANASAATLGARAKELEASSDERAGDLETELDAIRILRREETCLAACVDLGGVAPISDVSNFLSTLAESIASRALKLAQDELGGGPAVSDFSVLGMGTIAGREFTYHSDLDLIFLCSQVSDDISMTSRVGQRMISYLANLTGAGIAYAVDTRLRPSGRQGVLVTSFDRFERYQLESAETWEHIALLRARAIAGQCEEAQKRLENVRQKVLATSANPWKYIAEMRTRVERERATPSENTISIKAGRGGLMDVDFLAAGGVLEMRPDDFPSLPSVPAMLKCVAEGKTAAQLLDDFAHLRLIESRVRLIAGRAIDEVKIDGEDFTLLGELIEPGIEAEALLDGIRGAQERIRATFEYVLERGQISALAN
jgi:glutamate-ammonia-ligase adenylyltransferase